MCKGAPVSGVDRNWSVGEDVICGLLGFDAVRSCDRRFGGTYRCTVYCEVRVPEDGRDTRVIKICDVFETRFGVVTV